MASLVIVIPDTRRACGRAVLFAADGHALLGPIRILATSSRRIARKHGNAARDRLLPFGHPPAGTYYVAGSLPPGRAPNARRASRFGSLGAIVLAPRDGDALAAAKNGRRYVLLHGGPLDADGRLRPTRGGFRVADADLTSLFAAVNQANAAGDPVSSVQVVDVPAAKTAPAPSSADRPGRRLPKRGARMGASHAALFVAAFGLLRSPRDLSASNAPADVGRRRFVAAALLLGGALGMAACSDGDDHPSACEPVRCDPTEPWCPPSGYICPVDVPPVVAGGGSPPPPPAGDPGWVDPGGGGGVDTGGDTGDTGDDGGGGG